MKKYLFVPLLAVSIVLLLFIVSKNQDIDIPNSHASQEVQTNPVNNEELIANFPNFPTYPDSTLMDSSFDKNNRYNAKWQSNDSVYTITKWYESLIDTKNGWKFRERPGNGKTGEEFMVLDSGDWLYYLIIERYQDYNSTEIDLNVIPKSIRK